MLRSEIHSDTHMAANVKSNRFLLAAGCLAVAFAVGAAARPQSEPMVITLTGQSMIRSDIRAAAPAAVPVIQSLLNGDVKFTNFEAAVGEKGEAVHEGGGFLAPPEALDALTTLGFNLLSLSNNHAFDLKLTGLENTLREVKKRKIVHAGTAKRIYECVVNIKVVVAPKSNNAGQIPPVPAQLISGPMTGKASSNISGEIDGSKHEVSFFSTSATGLV